jgi:hypothetical protein
MSNYYTHFQVSIPVPGMKAKKWANDLLSRARDHEIYNDDEVPKDVLAVFPDWRDFGCVGFEWSFEKRRTGKLSQTFLILGDEGGAATVEHVAQFIGAFIRKFSPMAKIGFQWSNTADRAGESAFGGGACVVTETSEEWFSTLNWLHSKGVAP